MQTKLFIFITFIALLYSCNHKNNNNMSKENKAIFLHHSTGFNIWKGNVSKVSWKLFKEGDTQKAVKKLNKKYKTNFTLDELWYPKNSDNNPIDYYNIWIKENGQSGELSLESFTENYGLIIFKHCFPISNIEENDSVANIESTKHTLDNYKLQYEALKKKMHEFPETKFLIWTGATNVQGVTTEESAQRMREFSDWVRNEWNEKDDNIFLWDFYELETEGSLYLKDEFAYSVSDSHPNKNFAAKTSEYFVNRIFDVFLGKADETKITGKE